MSVSIATLRPDYMVALTDQLNEMARLHYAEEQMLGHSPSSPRYWFLGLLRELPYELIYDRLSDDARRLAGSCSDPDCYPCAFGCPDRCTRGGRAHIYGEPCTTALRLASARAKEEK